MANPKTVEELLSGVAFVVECSDFEKFALFQRWAKQAVEMECAAPLSVGQGYNHLDWTDDNSGWSVQVGWLNERPVCISVTGATLDGVRVLFYEASSQVVDWRQIENWFKAHCWPTWDSGLRRAHCNAENFHLCCQAIEERRKSSDRL